VVWLLSCYKFVYKSSHKMAVQSLRPTFQHCVSCTQHSLSLSLSQMQFNSLPQNARQFNSVPLISSPFHFKDSMISCSIINMHSYSNNNYSWSCEGLFAHPIHSTSLSLAFTHSLFFSNVSSIITGSVGCYGVS